MMPNGTAHTTTSRMVFSGAPRLRIRLSAIHAATTMPSTMHRAYARSGIGPRCHTDVLGLGMLAKVTADTLPPPPVSRQPGLPPVRFGAFAVTPKALRDCAVNLVFKAVRF